MVKINFNKNYHHDEIGYIKLRITYIKLIRQSNFFWPHPPGTPGDITFFGCPGPLITLFFLVPPYIITNFTLFSSARPFYHTHFSSDPGAALGGMGAERFGRRISATAVAAPLL